MKSVKEQTYSFSRLNSFAQCPHKWYQTYVEGFKEPSRSYFTLGTICHRVAELSSQSCNMNTFLNKAEVFYEKSEELQSLNKGNIEVRKFLMEIYDNKSIIAQSKFKTFGRLTMAIDKIVDTDEYELVSMPSREKYDQFFMFAVTEERCSDPEIIEEARGIMNRFYDWYDYTILPNEILLAEKKLAYTKDWKPTGFLSKNAYFRGVIDSTLYSPVTKGIVISDYKTSRSMLTRWQVSEDPQLRSYVKMMVHKLGINNIETVTIRIVYMRFREIIEYTFDNIQEIVDESTAWINGMINEIEKRGDNPDKFEPTRNEHCNRCFLREDNMCPLFVREKYQEVMSLEVSDEETCSKAWKESEILKDRYESYQKQCKEFITNTDGVVIIDDEAILDKHFSIVKKFIPIEVVTLALQNGARLTDILSFMSIPEKSVNKMFAKLGIRPTDEEYGNLYKEGKRSTFKALTSKEVEKL